MNHQQRLLIKNGTLIDGTGAEPAPNHLIVVEGRSIAHVGPRDNSMRPETPDDIVIDAKGKFILPGLIDSHCHISLHQGELPGVRYTSTAEFCTLWAARSVARVLHAGVTSIAVPGGKWFTDVTVREAVNGGLLQGPRMVVGGRALTNYGSIFDPDPFPSYEGTPDDTVGILCNTRDEFVVQTRKQCRRGVDLVKIADSYWGDMQSVADEEIQAVVDEAHRHHVKVVIHSRGSASTRAAAKAGVDLIYHADLATDEDLDIVAEKRIPISPVFTGPWIACEYGDELGFNPEMQKRMREQLEFNYETIRKARKKGIEILSGSDTGNAAVFVHGRWHGKEAELFVKELGMTPMEAIVANTSKNADMVGLKDQVGIVAPGKLADVVVWDNDPIKDITVLQRPTEISVIIKDGKIVDREVEGFRHLKEEPKRAKAHIRS